MKKETDRDYRKIYAHIIKLFCSDEVLSVPVESLKWSKDTGISRSKINEIVSYLAAKGTIKTSGRGRAMVITYCHAEHSPQISPEVVDFNIPFLSEAEDNNYALFLKSAYWKFVVGMVKRRDGYRCQHCGSENRLQVHHKTYKHHLEEHKNLWDLITLCDKCHKREHSKTKKKKKHVKTNPNDFVAQCRDDANRG